MLRMIMDAFSAIEQLGMLFAGLVCLGVAVLVVLAEVQTRRRSVKVQGRIVGVRCSGTVSGMEKQLDPSMEISPPPDPDMKSFKEDFKKSPGAMLVALLFASIVVFVPLALFGGGAYFAWDYLDLKAHGARAQAKVVRIETNYSSDGDTRSIIVAYTDGEGRKHENKDRIGTGFTPRWKKGSSVDIIYDPGSPERFRVDNFWHNMGLPLGLMGISGGVLFFLFIRPRLKREKEQPGLPGKIRALEAVGRYYYPVYEYTAPDGKVITAHSSSGSNTLSNKIIGTTVTLYADPEAPWDVSRSGLALTALLTAFFLIPAFIFLYMSFVTFKFNIFTVLFTLAFLAYCGVKIAKTIKPRDQWEKPSEFKLRRKEARRKKMQNPPGYILSPDEFRERLRAIDRYNKILSPFIVLGAISLLAGGFYMDRDMRQFSAQALKTRGEVVSLQGRRSGDGYSYYPVVSFATTSGHQEKFVGKSGANPPLYREGDVVDVLYDPGNSRRAQIDHGLLSNLPALACYGFGILLLLLQVNFWNGLRRRAEEPS